MSRPPSRNFALGKRVREEPPQEAPSPDILSAPRAVSGYDSDSPAVAVPLERREALPPLKRLSAPVVLRTNKSWLPPRIKALPGGGRFAVPCTDGHVRVFASDTKGDPLVDIVAAECPIWTVSPLGDDVLATGTFDDSRIQTWSASTGEPLGALDLMESLSDQTLMLPDGGTFAYRRGRGVGVITYLCPSRFVVAVPGFEGCDMVFLTHRNGREIRVEKIVEGAHRSSVHEIAVSEERFATASHDTNVGVWNAKTGDSVGTCRGHTSPVQTVDFSRAFIVSGGMDATVVLHSTGAGYPCLTRICGFHTRVIYSVSMIPKLPMNHAVLMTASGDGTVCFLKMLSGTKGIEVVARVKAGGMVMSAEAIGNGRIALGSKGGRTIKAPAVVADAVKLHEADLRSALASSGESSSGLPPLETKVMLSVEGCTDPLDDLVSLLTPEACSSSMREWWCGHLLLMMACSKGQTRGQPSLLQKSPEYWYQQLYVHAKDVVKSDHDVFVVQSCLESAVAVGVIEQNCPIIAEFANKKNLVLKVYELEVAEDRLALFLSRLLLDQLAADKWLSKLVSRNPLRDQQVLCLALILESICGAAPDGESSDGTGVRMEHLILEVGFERFLQLGVWLKGVSALSLLDAFVQKAEQVVPDLEDTPWYVEVKMLNGVEGLGASLSEFQYMLLRASSERSSRGEGRVVGR